MKERPNALAVYLARAKESHRDFAARAGIPHLHPMVSQWTLGKARPGLGVALAIEEATGGAVPAAYWLTVPHRQRATRKRRPSRSVRRVSPAAPQP